MHTNMTTFHQQLNIFIDSMSANFGHSS